LGLNSDVPQGSKEFFFFFISTLNQGGHPEKFTLVFFYTCVCIYTHPVYSVREFISSHSISHTEETEPRCPCAVEGGCSSCGSPVHDGAP